MMADDDLSPEQHAHMTGAAMGLVCDWLEAVFDNGDLSAVWHLVDAPLRLALVQSWILMEEDRPDIAREDRDELASALASLPPSHPLWSEFSDWRTARWNSVLPPFVTDASCRGFVSAPALVGVDLEAVLVADTNSVESQYIDAGKPVVVQRLLVRHTSRGPRLAGIGGVLPIPGWPPSETDRLPR